MTGLPNPDQKTVAIVQSSYIPWKGYFDLIRAADVFIFLDTVQYTRRDWRNRNRIKTPQGLRWLSVPVQSKHHFHQTIGETRVAGPWAGKHWATIRQYYKPAPHFALFAAADKLERLSDVNALFIRAICEILHIRAEIRQADEFDAADDPTQRLVDLSQAVGATRYLTGPSAASYLDVALFHDRDTEVCFVDYDGYPEYPQPPPPFEHGVTILDLLFHTGEKARDYMKDLTPHDG